MTEPILTRFEIAIFFVLALVMAELLFPAIRGRQSESEAVRERRLGAIYMLVCNPLLRPVMARIAQESLILLSVAIGMSQFAILRQGFGPMAALPLWAQVPLSLFLADLAGYWGHRIFHTRAFWRFHAIHHGAEEMNWLSGAHVHPVNTVVEQMIRYLGVLLLGFSVKVFLIWGGLMKMYTIFIHANVRLDFGPLRRVLVSPDLHRWHHASEKEAHDSNYALVFSCIDVLFGTYYFPEGRKPESLGCADPIPRTLLGEFLYPFKGRSKVAEADL